MSIGLHQEYIYFRACYTKRKKKNAGLFPVCIIFFRREKTCRDENFQFCSIEENFLRNRISAKRRKNIALEKWPKNSTYFPWFFFLRKQARIKKNDFRSCLETLRSMMDSIFFFSYNFRIFVYVFWLLWRKVETSSARNILLKMFAASFISFFEIIRDIIQGFYWHILHCFCFFSIWN